MLEKKIIDFPIIGGLNQKEGDLVSQRPLVMTNCLYRKSGQIEKRNGYQEIGPYNLDNSGSSVPTGERLDQFGDSLVRLGQGKIHSFGLRGVSDWIENGRISEASLSYERIAMSEGLSIDPTITNNGTYKVVVYGVYEGPATQQYVIYIDIFDMVNGAKVLNRYRAYAPTSATTISTVRSVIDGAYVYIFWVEASNALKYMVLNLSSITLSSAATLIASLGGDKVYDVICTGSKILLVYEKTSGANRITLQPYTVVSGTLAADTAITSTSTDTTVSAFAVQYNSTNYGITWASFDGYTTYSVRTQLFTTAGSATSITTHYANTYEIQNVGIGNTNAGRFVVVWSQYDLTSPTDRGLFWNEVNMSNSIFYPLDNRVSYYMMAASKPFLYNGRNYLIASNIHSVAETFFLVDLSTGESQTVNTGLRLVGATGLRQVAGIYFAASVPSVSPIGSGEYEFGVVLTNQSVEDRQSVSIVNIDFNMIDRLSSHDLIGILSIGGGSPSSFDGDKAVEFGFAYEPDYNAIQTPSVSSGGSLTPSSTYSYRFIYEWFDAVGNRYQSAPSGVVQATLGGSDTKVVVHVPCLNLTNKSFPNSDANKVQVVAYRTTATGTIFFRALTNYSYSTNGEQTVELTDTMSDAVLSTKEQLYTTGGVVDNVLPPSAKIVHFHKRAIFLAGTDDDSIWISKEVIAGESPSFNDTLVISAFEGGRVSGLATINDALVIFKESGIWIVSGDPPNDLGQSNLSSPQKLQVDVGCTDVKSIGSTKDGIFFNSGKSGIYLLTRDLDVVPVGKNIEDNVNENTTFAGSVNVPGQNAIKLFQYNSYQNNSFNYDYYHSRTTGSPTWSIDNFTDGYVVAATIWNNNVVYLTSSGKLYRENSSTYLDTNFSGSTTFIPMTFETSFEKVVGLNGYHRIWRVNVVGGLSSNHGLTMTLTSDQGTESKTWAYNEINLGNTVEQLQIHCQNQKVSFMKVRIQDSDPGASFRGTGKGFILKGISAEFGVKQGQSKLRSGWKK